MSDYDFGHRLEEPFFARQTELVAKELLGKWVIHTDPHGMIGGIIVETEAYLGFEDPACHSKRGCTVRNKVMFGPAGNIYIYFIYGIYYCLNVTTASLDKPEAVLIRAVEPKIGVEVMQQRRNRSKLKELCSGPGKLVQALGIDSSLNGCSASVGPIAFYQKQDNYPINVFTTTRIGIGQATELPLRFYIQGNEYISKP